MDVNDLKNHFRGFQVEKKVSVSIRISKTLNQDLVPKIRSSLMEILNKFSEQIIIAKNN